MSVVNAIIFDLDGVLVNTIEMHYQAWRKVAQSGGRELTRTQMEELRGVQRNECLSILFPDRELTPDVVDYFIQIKHNSYTEALRKLKPQDVLIDNALDIIYKAREMGLKLGIASSSMNALRVLEHVGIASLFDRIAGGDKVVHSKPRSDIFVWVAGALGVFPRHALVFEDSVKGIRGAKDANMKSVGVVNPDTKPLADIYYDKLSDVDLETLLFDLDLRVGGSPHRF